MQVDATKLKKTHCNGPFKVLNFGRFHLRVAALFSIWLIIESISSKSIILIEVKFVDIVWVKVGYPITVFP